MDESPLVTTIQTLNSNKKKIDLKYKCVLKSGLEYTIIPQLTSILT